MKRKTGTGDYKAETSSDMEDSEDSLVFQVEAFTQQSIMKSVGCMSSLKKIVSKAQSIGEKSPKWQSEIKGYIVCLENIINNQNNPAFFKSCLKLTLPRSIVPDFFYSVRISNDEMIGVLFSEIIAVALCRFNQLALQKKVKGTTKLNKQIEAFKEKFHVVLIENLKEDKSFFNKIEKFFEDSLSQIRATHAVDKIRQLEKVKSEFKLLATQLKIPEKGLSKSIIQDESGEQQILASQYICQQILRVQSIISSEKGVIQEITTKTTPSFLSLAEKDLHTKMLQYKFAIDQFLPKRFPLEKREWIIEEVFIEDKNDSLKNKSILVARMENGFSVPDKKNPPPFCQTLLGKINDSCKKIDENMKVDYFIEENEEGKQIWYLQVPLTTPFFTYKQSPQLAIPFERLSISTNKSNVWSTTSSSSSSSSFSSSTSTPSPSS